MKLVSLGTLVDYAKELGLEGAANYAWIAPIGIVIGYICGIIFIPKYLSQATALKICSILAIIGSLLVVLTPSHISIYFISFMALGCSLMWPALWPLAMADLGKFTKAGSSLLIMAMFGGAVIPYPVRPAQHGRFCYEYELRDSNNCWNGVYLIYYDAQGRVSSTN